MHGNFVSNAVSVRPAITVDPGDIELSFLPLSHVFERTLYYVVLSLGATIAEYSAHPRPETAAKVEKEFALLDAQIEKLRSRGGPVEADIWQQERDSLQLRYNAAKMAGNIQNVRQAVQELGNAFEQRA